MRFTIISEKAAVFMRAETQIYINKAPDGAHFWNSTFQFPPAFRLSGFKAGNGIRTRDPQLGKLTLYH